MSNENAKEYTFTWRIENYSLCYQKNGEVIKSPVFVAENLGGSKWYLRLYPKGIREECSEYISCFLCRYKIDSYRDECIIYCKIEMAGEEGKLLNSLETESVSFGRGTTRGWKEFIKISEALEAMKSWNEDTLIVQCHMRSEEQIKNPASECEALTRIGAHHCSLKLSAKISNDADYLERKIFTISENVIYEMNLCFSNDNAIVNIYKIQDTSSMTRRIYGKVSLLDVKGIERDSRTDSHSFEPLTDSDTWEFPTFISKKFLMDENNTYLKNGSFILLGKFSASNGIELTEVLDADYETFSSVDTSLSLRSELRNLMENKKFSDVQLQTTDMVMPVHKCVLAARSPVFSAMFDQKPLENQTDCYYMSDIDSETLKMFLHFIYSGTVDNMNFDSASKLLVIADKYQVQSLKKKCSLFLISLLSTENVCNMLDLAIAVNHKPLKTAALDYIAAHASDIMTSNEWFQWITKNVKLSSDVFSYLGANFCIIPKKTYGARKRIKLSLG